VPEATTVPVASTEVTAAGAVTATSASRSTVASSTGTTAAAAPAAQPELAYTGSGSQTVPAGIAFLLLLLGAGVLVLRRRTA
jgi:LPXTG-motif cell wall-anchored protein